jgi:hypothetical protein
MERRDDGGKITARILSSFRYLKIQVQEIEQRIDELEIESQKESGTKRYHAAMARLQNQLWVSRARCLEEEARLRDLIDRVEDPQMRSILTFYSIRGKNWTQVAFALGGNNTKAGVKARFYRWLEDQKSCN